MPQQDDAIIRATTQIDVSGLKTGGDEAVAMIKSQLAIMQEQYRVASTDIRQSVNRIVDAEKQAAEAMSGGFSDVSAKLQEAANKERAALDGLISKQDQLKNSVAQLKATVNGEAEAEAEAAAAAAQHAAEEMAEAKATEEARAAAVVAAAAKRELAAATTEARFAAQLLGRELGTPIPRALSSIASQAPIVGEALKLAFPVIAAVAFGQILADIVLKVREWYEGLDRVKELNETIGKELEDADRETAKLKKHAEESRLALLGVTKGPAAEQSAKSGILAESIGKDKAALVALEAQMRAVQARIDTAATKTQEIASHALSRSGDAVIDSKRTVTVQAGDPKAYKDLTEKVLPEVLANIQVMRSKIADEQASFALDTAKAGKDAAREAQAAQRKAEADARQREQRMRQADQDMLADMRADHELTITEVIDFWKKREVAEMQYGSRVREIKRELGTLYQQQDRENQRVAVQELNQGAMEARSSGGARGELAYLNTQKEQLANLVQVSSDYTNAYSDVIKKIPVVTKEAATEAASALKKGVDEQYERWLTGHTRSLEEIKGFWATVLVIYGTNAALAAEATRKIAEETIKIREEQQKLNDLRSQGQQIQVQGGLDQQREALQRAKSLSVDDSTKTEIEYLAKLREIDAQIIEEKLRTARAIALNDFNNPVKYQEDLNKIAQIQQAGNAKLYADTTAMLQRQQQAYTNFFNQLNQGFTKAIDGMITGQQSFARGMASMWQSLVVSLDNYIIHELLKEAEKYALKEAMALGFNRVLQALHLTAAVEEKTTQTVTGLSAIEANAAVAAAAAFASTAAIPIVGPELAPAAAAEAYAAVMAMSSLAAFETGGIVPRTGIIMAHENEGVLPAPLMSLLMNAAGQGGGVGAGATLNMGGVHFHGANTPRQAASSTFDALASEARRRNISIGAA